MRARHSAALRNDAPRPDVATCLDAAPVLARARDADNEVLALPEREIVLTHDEIAKWGDADVVGPIEQGIVARFHDQGQLLLPQVDAEHLAELPGPAYRATEVDAVVRVDDPLGA